MTVSQDINNFVRPTIKSLVGFEYNKSPDLLRERIPAEEVLKLNANENPYGCTPGVYRMLAECKTFHIYPDATEVEIRKLLAEYAGTIPERIVVTGGAEKLLDLITRLFVDAGDEVITCSPTLELYRLCSQVMGGIVIDVPRLENHDVNIDAVLKATNKKTRLIFLCNPNNPTGNIIPEESIIEVLKTGVPVVVDEAYYEFSNLTMLPWIDKYPNMIIVRTCSKWAAMAGFRLGYGIMDPKLTTYMYTIKPAFGVSVPARIALKASLEDIEQLRKTWKMIINERERVYRELDKMDSVKPYPSRGNFLFFDILKGEASQINLAMEERGILVRNYNTPSIRRGIRLTIGKPEQNDKVLANLKELLAG